MRRSDWRGEEEATVVLAASSGDLSAFDELARRYRSALVSIGSQIVRSTELAEDAAQDALLTAYAALPSLQDEDRFGPWLASILRHRAIRLAKGERRDPTPLDEILLSYAPALTMRLVEDERNRALWEAVQGLPEELRPIVELYYREEWPIKKISAFLDLPNTTVKWRLHAARKQLRNCLSHLMRGE